MAISVAYATKLDTTETIATSSPFLNSGSNQVLQSGMSDSGVLSASSTPPVSLDAYFQQAMTVGAATIDLTALVGTNGAAVSFSGKKVIIAKFRNPAANPNPITVKFGAANAYLIGGAAGWTHTLQPGDSVTYTPLSGTGPSVDGTHKNIDISGTGSQALDVGLVAG